MSAQARPLDEHASEPGVEARLRVANLRVTFSHGGRRIAAVRGVNFEVRGSTTLAIIGESGSGKSVTARAIMGLLPPHARVSGSICLEGRELTGLSDRELGKVRGREVALVPQDPARSLNPTIKIGRQIVEALRVHLPLSKDAARQRALELLEMVRLPSALARMDDYPHQLSGGMRQRAVIAMALACSPRLLIADEATTALDVTTQAQIMDLLVSLQRELGMAMILISHDMGIAASYTDEVAVMYAGQVVERAPTFELFDAVRMPYTQALLDAVPNMTDPPHVELAVVAGRPPDPAALPVGCAFSTRCPRVEQRCKDEPPELLEHEVGHWYSCFYPLR